MQVQIVSLSEKIESIRSKLYQRLNTNLTDQVEPPTHVATCRMR
jgi:hypothetical protein